MTTATPPLPQLIGQTEKTLNAILDRALAGAVTEPQWVALVLTAAASGSVTRDQLTERVAWGLRTDLPTAADHLKRLAALDLIRDSADFHATVSLAEAGQQLITRVHQQVDPITERLWGDLSFADLGATGRVLSTILSRAESELSQFGACR